MANAITSINGIQPHNPTAMPVAFQGFDVPHGGKKTRQNDKLFFDRPLFYVLGLLSYLLDLRFEVDDNLCHLRVISF